jgi:hypothetical protein
MPYTLTLARQEIPDLFVPVFVVQANLHRLCGTGIECEIYSAIFKPCAEPAW